MMESQKTQNSQDVALPEISVRPRNTQVGPKKALARNYQNRHSSSNDVVELEKRELRRRIDLDNSISPVKNQNNDQTVKV